jgi:hypothetical protein
MRNLPPDSWCSICGTLYTGKNGDHRGCEVIAIQYLAASAAVHPSGSLVMFVQFASYVGLETCTS